MPLPNQDLSPTDYGWTVMDGLLKPVWFIGQATPSTLFAESKNSHGNGSDSTNMIIQEPIDELYSRMDTTDDEGMSDFDLSDDEPWSEDSDSDQEIPH